MGKNSSHTPDITIAERRSKIADLRRAGVSIRKIAAQLNISPALVHKELKSILAETHKLTNHTINEMITLELDRLDNLLFRLDAKIRQGDIKAILAAVKIIHQRSALQGLYPAPKSPVTPESPMANTDKAVAEWKKKAAVNIARAEATLAAYSEVESFLDGDYHSDQDNEDQGDESDD